ncbi:XRE family transcriptional regulator [Exiguobacterium sp. s63]|uniref:LexA family protein n=1 Tax=Exiguobacterium sp. s63 TaxID=2751274 RepID=UPI001BE843C0|nr:XRE family transcriptional regulator [Exiguobacterium sp. s63]
MSENLKAIFADNLKFYLSKKRLRTSDLAKELNIPYMTIANWVNAKTYPRPDKIQLMADFFGIPRSYLTEKREAIIREDESEYSTLPPEAITRITASNYKIPVYGSISAGIPLEAIENLTETSVPDHVILKYGEENLFGLLVRGDSMNKIVHDGHYAILCKTDQVDSGEVAAVIVNGYDATLKRIILLDRGILLEPSSFNPDHAPKMYLDQEAKDIKVIGRLVAVMSPPDFKF